MGYIRRDPQPGMPPARTIKEDETVGQDANVADAMAERSHQYGCRGGTALSLFNSDGAPIWWSTETGTCWGSIDEPTPRPQGDTTEEA